MCYSIGPRSRPPVLVVIEDFEGFVPQILQDLIMSFRYSICVCVCMGGALWYGSLVRNFPIPRFLSLVV